MSNTHIGKHRRRAHVGEQSRNPWCVPSCLLHSQTLQSAQKTAEKSCQLLWSLEQSCLKVTIVWMGVRSQSCLLVAAAWWLSVGKILSPTVASENDNSRRQRNSGDVCPIPLPTAFIVLLVEAGVKYVRYKQTSLTVLEPSKWLQMPVCQVIITQSHRGSK